MFHIWLDNQKLHTLDSREFHKLSAAELETELNKAGTLNIKMPSVHNLYSSVKNLRSRITVYDDDDMIFKGRVIKQGKDYRNLKIVTAEGEFAYFNDSYFQPSRVGEFNTASLIPEIINGHNSQVDESRQFQVGNIDPYVFGVSSLKIYKSMQFFREEIINNTGGYFSVRYKNDVRYLDYSLSPGVEDDSTKIEFGVNLLDINEYIDSTALYTCIVPYGDVDKDTGKPLDISSVNGGVNYVENTAAVAHFGRIFRPVEFKGFIDAESLYSEAVKFTNSVVAEAITLDLTAIEMRQIDLQNPYGVFKQGNFYKVVSKPHGVDEFFLCTKKKTNLFLPENNKVQLGHTRNRLTDYIRKG